MADKTPRMSVEYNEETASFDLTFDNGEVRQIAFGPDHKLFAQAAYHGMEQRIRDKIAGRTDTKECVTLIDSLKAVIDEGEWGIRREGNGEPTGGILAKALARMKGCPLAEAVAFVRTLDKKTQAAYRADPDVSKVVEQIKAEAKANAKPKSAPKGVDVSALKAFFSSASAETPASE